MLCSRNHPTGTVWNDSHRGMALSKLVVATKLVQLLILVEGETCLLVELGDIEAMSTAVSKLLMEPDLCMKMGNTGRSRVEDHFNSNRNVSQVEEIYRSML
jgi:glycosyltransferase involved in cell wall biosynthesis